MSYYLLDVNVLIALLDENHDFHGLASTWFEAKKDSGWASCPITENGVVRIMSGTRYPNRPGGPQNVLALLEELRDSGDHQFWPDEITLRDPSIFNLRQVDHSKAITDLYLLALAKTKSGKFATLDRRIKADGVIGGAEALYIIPA